MTESEDKGYQLNQNQPQSGQPESSSVPGYLKLTAEEEEENQDLRSRLLQTMKRVCPNPQHAEAAVENTLRHRSFPLLFGGGNLGYAKQALIDGINVNEVDDPAGLTPLHYAVKNGEPKVVQLLLLCGADPTAKAPSGETPIDLARATRADNLLKMMMIASGQEPQSVDNFLQQIQPDESKWEQLYSAGKRANELGNLAEAEKLFCAALQEAEKFAHLELRLAKTLKSLGRVYENTGRQDDAKPLYKRFVEIMERADAKRDPEYVDHMMRLAESWASAGDHRMAAECAWSVLAGANFPLKPPPPDQNRPSYERALEIVASNPALDSSRFESLAHFYLALGRFNEAEHFLIAAVRTLQYPELYYSLRGLASFYEKQQKHEQAKAVREDIEAIKRIHGEPNQEPWG